MQKEIKHKSYAIKEKPISFLSEEFIEYNVIEQSESGVSNIGNEVFGSIDSFKQWMQKPAYGLGNKIPSKILTTISGINLVINQLMRIAHGVLA